jgi:ubiquinone/menaquinone biosynthesis C-methylase UbiE
MLPDRDPEGVETSILHRMVNVAELRVLEIGSGDGRLSWRYAGATRQVVGIDLDPVRLATALENKPSSLTQVNIVQAQAETLPFRAECFDLAILAWSL